MELQIMLCGEKISTAEGSGSTQVYGFRELDELTEQWLQEKLCN